MKTLKIFFSFCVAVLFVHTVYAQIPYEKKTAKLMTVWGRKFTGYRPSC